MNRWKRLGGGVCGSPPARPWGFPPGVAPLGGTRRTSLTRVGRAGATTTLLGCKLLNRLCCRRGRRDGRLNSSLLRLGLLPCLSLWLGVLGRLVLCVLSHVYPFQSSSSACQLVDAAWRAASRSPATVSAR